ALGVDHATQFTYEIFQPPYFFQGARPTITACPTTLSYNSPYTITTPDANQITKVRLIRTGAATHSFDQNQRAMELMFAVTSSNTIKIRTPLHGGFAPPGYYMLFICKDSP